VEDPKTDVETLLGKGKKAMAPKTAAPKTAPKTSNSEKWAEKFGGGNAAWRDAFKASVSVRSIKADSVQLSKFVSDPTRYGEVIAILRTNYPKVQAKKLRNGDYKLTKRTA
jgi:hypothetical protein